MERLLLATMPFVLLISSLLLLAVCGSYLWDIFVGEAPSRDR